MEEARTGPAHDPLRMHGHRRGGRVRLRSPLAPPANVRLFCSCAYILLLLLLRFIEVVPDCETTASIQKVCFCHRASCARLHSTALTLNRPFDGTHRKLAVRRRCSRTRCSPTGSRNTTRKVLPPSRVPGTSPFAHSPPFPPPLRSCVRAHRGPVGRRGGQLHPIVRRLLWYNQIFIIL